MFSPLRRLISVGCFLWLLFGPGQAGFATEGTFEGKIVDASPDERLPDGWIFVQGRNHLLRRVEIAHATVVFGREVPAGQRRKCGPECLEAGQEIRVTADQDSSGEWRAKRVEILRLASVGSSVVRSSALKNAAMVTCG